MELKNVTRYYPEDMPHGENIQYFRSEDGKDFYESIEKFTKKYSLCIEPLTGIVRSIAEDTSRLYPVGYTVVETDSLPDGVDIYGGWCFIKGTVSKIPTNYLDKAETERQRLINETNKIIADWVTDLQLGVITDEDKSSLILWRSYIKSLRSLDLNNISDEVGFKTIKWPEVPGDVA